MGCGRTISSWSNDVASFCRLQSNVRCDAFDIRSIYSTKYRNDESWTTNHSWRSLDLCIRTFFCLFFFLSLSLSHAVVWQTNICRHTSMLSDEGEKNVFFFHRRLLSKKKLMQFMVRIEIIFACYTLVSRREKNVYMTSHNLKFLRWPDIIFVSNYARRR